MSAGRRSGFAEGAAAAWPICLGYVPIGLAFGVLAAREGLGPLETGLMSVIVFAGSAQFAAVGMLGQGVSGPAIVAATFMINLRHFLMSSALSVHLREVGRRFLALFAYGVTDESFAVNMVRFTRGGWGPRRALVLNQAANATWIMSTVAGAWAGGFIPEGAFGIDYALTAMFLCLIVLQLRGRAYVLTAILAGVLAVIMRLAVPGNAYIVVASASAAAVGSVVRRRPWARGVAA